MAVHQEASLTREVEGRYFSPKMQWWCVHCHVITDDGARWDVYVWPAIGSLDEAWIASLHTRDEVIDLTTLHLPSGSIEAGRDGVDVRFGRNSLLGSFPDYDIHLEGEDAAGAEVSVDLEISATMPAFEAVPDLVGITWHYVPRMTAAATIVRGGDTISASGSGYIERRRGRFWAPGIRMGLWESIPDAPGTGLSIPLMYKVWKNDGQAQLQTLTFSDDGRQMVDMPDVEIEILEDTQYAEAPEVYHPIRFKILAEGPDGHAEIVVKRDRHRLIMRDYFSEPDSRSSVIGMYGTGHATGTLSLLGRSHDIDADSFGSALFFGTDGQFSPGVGKAGSAS